MRFSSPTFLSLSRRLHPPVSFHFSYSEKATLIPYPPGLPDVCVCVMWGAGQGEVHTPFFHNAALSALGNVWIFPSCPSTWNPYRKNCWQYTLPTTREQPKPTFSWAKNLLNKLFPEESSSVGLLFLSFTSIFLWTKHFTSLFHKRTFYVPIHMLWEQGNL